MEGYLMWNKLNMTIPWVYYTARYFLNVIFSANIEDYSRASQAVIQSSQPLKSSPKRLTSVVESEKNYSDLLSVA